MLKRRIVESAPVVVGCVLGASAIAKVGWPVPLEDTLFSGVLTGPLLSAFWRLGVPAAELLLALSMILAGDRRIICRIGAVMLTLFAGVGIWSVLQNQNCGCFGSVVIPKALLIAFDFTAALALALRSHSIDSSQHLRPQLFISTALLVLSTVVLSLAAAQIYSARQTLWLDLPSQSGQRVDVLDHLLPTLPQGNREGVFVFHRDSCERCRTLLAKLRTEQGRLAVAGDKPLFLIDVEPRAAQVPFQIPNSRTMRLRPNISLFAQTPAILHIEAGRVVKIIPES